MEFITKNSGGSEHHFLVFLMNRCTSKSKEDSTGKGSTNGTQHITKHIAMTLVNNDHKALLVDSVDLMAIVVSRHNTAHLLNRSNYQSILCVKTIQFAYQIRRILSFLYIFQIRLESTILQCGLSTQFYAVHQEYHFVCLSRIRYQLSRFERGHRLSRTCSMPYKTAKQVMLIPTTGCYTVSNSRSCIVLITAHYL